MTHVEGKVLVIVFSLAAALMVIVAIASAHEYSWDTLAKLLP